MFQTQEQAVSDPPVTVDPDWQARIAVAIQARRETQLIRQGKSPVFPMNWSLLPAKA